MCSGGGAKKRVLNYWCFSTGLAIEEIKRLGVRSILLTSGTLSPMDSFKEDLRLPFPIELENPHVINEKKQIWVGALSTGPSGKELNSSYAHRDLSHTKDELGNTILHICQTMVGLRDLPGSRGNGSNNVGRIPPGPELKGGVLVFFPSYGALESCRKHWAESGLWAKLKSTMGYIVLESKSGGGSGNNSSSINSNQNNKSNFFSEQNNQGTGSGAGADAGNTAATESAIVEFENALQTVGL